MKKLLIPALLISLASNGQEIVGKPVCLKSNVITTKGVVIYSDKNDTVVTYYRGCYYAGDLLKENCTIYHNYIPHTQEQTSSFVGDYKIKLVVTETHKIVYNSDIIELRQE